MNLVLGYQILIRYRSSKLVAPVISLSEVMSFSEADLKHLVADRIVLIGYVGESARDFHETPVGRMPGVYIHAHAISQLLDTLSGQPANFTAWSDLGEAIWIGFWAVIGTLTGISQLKGKQLVRMICVCILTASCYGFYLLAIWIPLIPAALSYCTATLLIVLANQKDKILSIREF